MDTTPSPAPPSEPGTGDPRRILLRQDCREEEAGTLLPSCMLAELQEPGANCRDRVVRASLGELGTHSLALCLAPSRRGGGRGQKLAPPAGGTGAPTSAVHGPQGANVGTHTEGETLRAKCWSLFWEMGTWRVKQKSLPSGCLHSSGVGKRFT